MRIIRWEYPTKYRIKPRQSADPYDTMCSRDKIYGVMFLFFRKTKNNFYSIWRELQKGVLRAEAAVHSEAPGRSSKQLGTKSPKSLPT